MDIGFQGDYALKCWSAPDLTRFAGETAAMKYGWGYAALNA